MGADRLAEKKVAERGIKIRKFAFLNQFFDKFVKKRKKERSGHRWIGMPNMWSKMVPTQL